MQFGAGMLRDGDAQVAAIVQEVGYDSEAALARASERAACVLPAAWRRGLRSAA